MNLGTDPSSPPDCREPMPNVSPNLRGRSSLQTYDLIPQAEDVTSRVNDVGIGSNSRSRSVRTRARNGGTTHRWDRPPPAGLKIVPNGVVRARTVVVGGS